MSYAHAHAHPHAHAMRCHVYSRFDAFLPSRSLAGLPTDRPMWSDVGGREERRREDLKLPNSQWKWVSDWEVSDGRRRVGVPFSRSVGVGVILV